MSQIADPGLYVSTLFGARNGKMPHLVQGKNYNVETLSNVTPKSTADQITSSMVGMMPKHPFVLIDISAGIGGNTLSFLENKDIGLVISYENHLESRIMLMNNINAYDLGKKSIVPGESFETTIKFDISKFKGCAVYFNLPLAEDGIKINTKTIQEHLLHLKNKGVYIVMILLRNYNEISKVDGWDIQPYEVDRSILYVCICDENKKFADVDGGFNTYAKQLLNSNDVLYNINPDTYSYTTIKLPPRNGITIKKPLPTPVRISPTPVVARASPAPSRISPAPKPPAPVRASPAPSRISPAPKPPAPVSRASPAPNIVKPAPVRISSNVEEKKDKPEINANLPIPSANLTIDSPEWVDEFVNYLRKLLGLFISNRDMIDILLGKDNLQFWIQAWTHSTFDPEINYETLETTGDACIKYSFTYYLYQRFQRNISSAAITEFNSYYMSTEIQASMSRQLKMDKWILIDNMYTSSNRKLSDSVCEDLFESFVGVLDFVSNKTFAENSSGVIGVGVSNVYKFMIFLFSNVNFDFIMSLGKPKTVLIQEGNRLGWESNSQDNVLNGFKEKTINTGRTFECRIYLTAQALATLKDMKIIGVPEVIGYGKCSNGTMSEKKDRSTDAAYLSALRTLRDLGFTHEAVLKRATNVRFSRFDSELINSALAKSASMGYATFDFFRTKSIEDSEDDESYIMQLIGIPDKSKGTNLNKKILASVHVTSKDGNIKNSHYGEVKVIKSFLGRS